jgi:hypothetical protein
MEYLEQIIQQLLLFHIKQIPHQSLMLQMRDPFHDTVVSVQLDQVK